MKSSIKKPEVRKKGNPNAFFPKSQSSISDMPIIQAKLTIGQPGDRYEQEADLMAERVVSNSASPEIQHKCATCGQDEGAVLPKLQRMGEEEEELQMKPMVQRMEEEEEMQMKPMIQRMGDMEEEEMQMKPIQRLGIGKVQASPNLEAQLNSSKGGGLALPQHTQDEMGSSFGADFSNVRVHTGSEANKMNQSIQAQAFTHGSDVYFNEGKYNPDSGDGKKLLAHELTHTIQQGAVN